jgi:acetyltransferase-like isoleucine patch superfamily enzyme
METEMKIDIKSIIQLYCWKLLKFTRPSCLKVTGKIIFNRFSKIQFNGDSLLHVNGDLDLCSSSINMNNTTFNAEKLVMNGASINLSNCQINIGNLAHLQNVNLNLMDTKLNASTNFRLHYLSIHALKTNFNFDSYFFGQSPKKNQIQWDFENAEFTTGTNCRIQADINQKQSVLKIGNNSFINAGTYISCAEKIEVGDYVMISYDCLIFDNNSHQIDYKERRLEIDRGFPNGTIQDVKHKPQSAPVFIGNDVWIGVKSVILKGVSVGNKSIVAANTTITKNVPEKTIVYGNPNNYKLIESVND